MSDLPSSAAALRGSRIVADIGGTNGRFAIARDGKLAERHEYRNADFADLAALLARYLDDAGASNDDIEAACLAVAAPVSTDGEAKFTNAPWKVGTRALKAALKLSRVALINDFEAQAYGLMTVGDADVSVVSPGTPASPGTRVILGPGTGLGCAALTPAIEHDAPPVAVTSEGGHMGFAAESDADRRILDVARAQFGRTSWERVCCGAGIALVHRALAPDDVLEGVADGDPSEVVKAAIADPSSPAAASLRHYCGLLGSFAGDLALVFHSGAGVYLTGGVLTHLGDAFDIDAFMRRFVDKGRYHDWLSALPVSRITADDVALRGCANYLELVRAKGAAITSDR